MGVVLRWRFRAGYEDRMLVPGRRFPRDTSWSKWPTTRRSVRGALWRGFRHDQRPGPVAGFDLAQVIAEVGFVLNGKRRKLT
jgi:hypothetical protein